ncbi:DUF5333 domain-containing protein [Pseudooceanicola aestuarii]|uniref:DUF5333 domain-containing protein n=1 Tax=Pseudooceanicola aestuarii TaxID=2697319 RepID=UPI0013D32EF1|nr:DUF5333 domain-containing protein [Pseudooceanicola aestuarii]
MRLTAFASAKFLAPALCLTLALAPLAAGAKTPLRDVAEIDDNMLWVALAIEISDKCEAIRPRTLKGFAFLASLKGTAEDLGYTSDEINAYVDSDAEKARIRAKGEAYVKSQGFDPENTADLCTLGRAEIDRSSRIGSLLKAK